MPRKVTQNEAVTVYLKADFDLLQAYQDSNTTSGGEVRNPIRASLDVYGLGIRQFLLICPQ